MGSDSYKKEQIRKTLSTIGKSVDKYNDVAVENCVLSFRKVCCEESTSVFASPLGFGQVIVPKSREDDAREFCFSCTTEILDNTVKNLYHGHFDSDYDEFRIEDGSAEELVKRLYPTSYHEVNEEAGALPANGFYLKSNRLNESLCKAFSKDPAERADFFNESLGS